MNWTKDRPTTPGWYWIVCFGKLDVAQVYACGEHLRMKRADLYGTMALENADSVQWWLGPVEAPVPPPLGPTEQTT